MRKNYNKLIFTKFIFTKNLYLHIVSCNSKVNALLDIKFYTTDHSKDTNLKLNTKLKRVKLELLTLFRKYLFKFCLKVYNLYIYIIHCTDFLGCFIFLNT